MGRFIGFVIWLVFCVAFIIWGIYCCFSKADKPFGFWANAEQFKVKNVKGYNKALGKLFIVFGIVTGALGLPILFGGQNSPLILLSVVGMMFEVIVIMAVYTLAIEKKYKAG